MFWKWFVTGRPNEPIGRQIEPERYLLPVVPSSQRYLKGMGGRRAKCTGRKEHGRVSQFPARSIVDPFRSPACQYCRLLWSVDLWSAFKLSHKSCDTERNRSDAVVQNGCVKCDSRQDGIFYSLGWLFSWKKSPFFWRYNRRPIEIG